MFSSLVCPCRAAYAPTPQSAWGRLPATFTQMCGRSVWSQRSSEPHATPSPLQGQPVCWPWQLHNSSTPSRMWPTSGCSHRCVKGWSMCGCDWKRREESGRNSLFGSEGQDFEMLVVVYVVKLPVRCIIKTLPVQS